MDRTTIKTRDNHWNIIWRYYESDRSRAPTLLAKYIPHLSLLLVSDFEEDDSCAVRNYDIAWIENKIDFNLIKSFKATIEDSVKYTTNLEEIIIMIEDEHRGYAIKTQRSIVKVYREIAWEYDDSISFSDEIYEKLRNKLVKRFLDSSDNIRDISVEELEFSVDIFLCKYFIECKIFLKPPKNDSK